MSIREGRTMSPSFNSAGERDLDFRAAGRGLWRKKWRIILPTLLVAVLTGVGVNMLTPRYKSEVRVLIEGRESVFLRPEADKAGERDRSAVDMEAVTSQVQLVLSRDVAQQAIKELKLGERPEFDPVLRGTGTVRNTLMLLGLARDPLRATPEERVLESYYDRLTAYQIDRSRVITAEFQSTDPELAANAANTIAEIYLRIQQKVRLDQTRAAGQWLAGEIEPLRAKVAEAESKVEEFRTLSNLYVGPNNSSLSTQQLGELSSQMAIARSQ